MAAGLAGAMSAGAVTLTFSGVNPNEIVTLQVSSPSFSGGVYAGVYNLTVDGGATPSFCIDVSRQIYAGQTFNDYSYTDLSLAPLAPAGPMGLAAATDIEKLWAAYYSPSMNNQDAAALQVAIWEDVAAKVGTYSITVSGNDPVTNEAANMLSNLDNLAAQADLQGLVSPDGQNYVVPVPDTEPVPEPTTAGCFLFGLGVLACFQRFTQNRCS
jgi:hypothetical protein